MNSKIGFDEPLESIAARMSLPPDWEALERRKYLMNTDGSLLVPLQYEGDRDHQERVFRQILVRKKDGQGDLYLGAKFDNGAQKWEAETPSVLREKDVRMIFGMTLYLPFKCGRDCLVLIANVSVDLKEGRVWCVIKDIGGFVFDKIRDPIFAVAVIACAFFGLFFPFEGRVAIERVERAWHHVDHLREIGALEGSNHNLDVMHLPSTIQVVPDHKGIYPFFSQEYCLFIAYCYQTHGNSSDRRYEIRTLETTCV